MAINHLSCFRPQSLRLLTLAQSQVEFRLAKPDEKTGLRGKEPTYMEGRTILVTRDNNNIPEDERLLPSHFVLADGNVMVRLRLENLRVMSSNHHGSKHEQMYSDMFLYVPWENEEQFLGEARESEEACKTLWERYKESIRDLKNQLKSRIRSAWLD